MIRTMIVDDEVWVCKLICNIVDWNAYGYEIIGQSYSGIDALEAIRTEKPDLVFTDIRMPGIDGLSLIRETENISPETKFVIISGYSDFEYAKTAIDLDVLGYLLKPVEPEDLSTLLVKLNDTSFLACGQTGVLHEELKKSRRQYREQFLYNFLMMNPDASRLCSEPFGPESGFSYREGCFQVFQMTLDEKNASLPALNHSIFQTLASKWYSLLSPQCFDVCVVRVNMSAVCVCNYSAEHKDRVRVIADEIFHQCKNYVPDISRYSMTLGIGNAVDTAADIPASFRSAQDAVRARIILGADRIIDLKDKAQSSASIPDAFLPRYKNLILRYLNHTCEYDAQQATAVIFEEFDKTRLTDNPGIIFHFALQFIDSLYSALSDSGVSPGEPDALLSAKQKVESISSISLLKQYLAELLETGRKAGDLQKNKTVSSIDILKTYIEEHFSEDISLNDLAGQIYLTPKYISELFKKETGVNFSDYLASVRIEKAKAYLVDPRRRIGDIALLVGYSDIKHFTKLFKKLVGVTPSEFRKLHC